MKITFNKIFCLLSMGVLTFACNESDDLVTEHAREGGILNFGTSLNYVVGNPDGPYTLAFTVNQGNEKVKQINLYKSFTKTEKYTVIVDGEEVEKDSTFTSNEVLDRTINVTEGTSHSLSTAYTFDELLTGLTVASVDAGAGPLPANDGDYQIGDKWVFRIESVLEDDRLAQQSNAVSVSVSTRYAGIYRALVGEYYRLGVPTTGTSGWPPETVIESVDATTYRVVEYFGPFDANEFYFQIINGVITYPEETPSGDRKPGTANRLLPANPILWT